MTGAWRAGGGTGMGWLDGIDARVSDLFQPDRPPDGPDRQDYVVAQKRLAALVGLVAFLLPVALLATTWAGCRRESISDYYYATFAGDLFVAGLAIIATFLFAYQADNLWENRLANVAAAAAIVVALFPTQGPGCDAAKDYRGRGNYVNEIAKDATDYAIRAFDADLHPNPPFTGASTVHLLAATALFVMLGAFCLGPFRRVVAGKDTAPDGSLTPAKRRRNGIYLASGLVILGCVAVLGIAAIAWSETSVAWWTDRDMTFWLEWVALWAFGLSWAVKGRLFGIHRLLDPGEPARVATS